MTHTKGPWNVPEYKEQSIDADSLEIAIVSCRRKEWRANARLIAAAPDLLSALEAMVDAVDMGDDLDHALDCTDAERCALCQARAAIDKARGIK